ncbi:MAG: Gfo/Idh/MocA family protein [Candidatus Dormibacter sp.]|uniref:Gfo/Idh/MocA family protein n=1 Tax=Candidatus Dormibacter sp. TaxID=2973982 RepID=UPI003D9B2965
MTIGWGIIGIGRIADSAMAPAITGDANSRLEAVVSRDEGRAEAFAVKHGAAAAGTSYEEMLANPQVDAVLICTPNTLHPDQVVAAARAGKHVLCDKPLGGIAADAARALQACKQAGVKLGINFQTRHHGCFQEARQAIAEGRIGDVISAQVDASPGSAPLGGWRTDVALAGLGATNNIAVHIYDLIRFLLDDDPTEVVAMFESGRAEQLERLPMVLMRFSRGALVYANGNQLTPKPLNDLVIHGTRGRIDARGLTRPGQEGRMRIVSGEDETEREYSSHDAYARTLAAFSHAVSEGREPNPSGLDGLRSVQLTDAIRRSAREGLVVPVGE